MWEYKFASSFGWWQRRMPSACQYSVRDVSTSVREYTLLAAEGEGASLTWVLGAALRRWTLLLLLLLVAENLAVRGAVVHVRTMFALVAVLVAQWGLTRGRVAEESLLVIRELGVQLVTRYRSGRERHRFLEHAEIVDVVINEGITFQRVVFYMAFVARDADRLVLAFETLQPKLPVLREIYSGVRADLHID